MSCLTDKVIVITGIAQGIGEAMARAMAHEGAIVVGCDLSEAGGTLIGELDPDGTRSGFAQVDITRGDDVRRFIDDTVARFGRIDVLVNNAAVLPPANTSLPDMAEADWQKVFDVNIGGAFRCSAAVIPHMIKAGGGTVISLSSIHRSHSIPGFTPYAASKGAIVSMSRQLAVEYGKHNLRFNTISPGAIATQMTQSILDGDPTGKLSEDFKHMHALERIGHPEEVAATAVFLASDGAAFISGEDILVDGGLTKTTRLEM